MKHYIGFILLFCLLWPLFLLLQFTSLASAAFNPEINYQGKLLTASSSAVADGTYSIVFRLYTVPTAGSNIWTETQSVSVQSGLFSVMLGTTTSLAAIDFNQTLYLGINVEADGEMTPRKILGAVPAAFQASEADNATTLGGVASTSFLRSDDTDTIVASTATTLLTIQQNGAGDILNLIDGGTEVFTVLDGGNVGIGTTTPAKTLSVAGDFRLTGAIFDSLNSAGISGYVLQSTATGQQWVSTSSLNISGADHDAVTLTGTPNYLTLSGQQITLTKLDLIDDLNTFSSANLVSLVTDETGTGRVVFSGSPAFSGTATFSSLTATGTATFATTTQSGRLTLSGSVANIALGSNFLSGDGGDEGIYIDASGNVGIGTVSPASLLNISKNQAGDTALYIFNSSTTAATAAETLLLGSAGSGGTYGYLRYANAGYTTAGQIHPGSLSLVSGTAANNGLTLATQHSTAPISFYVANGTTPSMTLNSSGNFGIGTTTPSQRLSIYANGADAAVSFGTAAGSAEKWTLGIDDSDGAKFKISSSSALGTNDRFVINGAGNIGVGDSTPDYLLDVAGTAGFDGLVTLTGTTANIALGSNFLSGDGDDEGVFVTSAGLVGIGTSTLVQTFSVQGSMRLTGAFYDRNNSAGTSGYVLQSNGSGTQWVATSTLGLGGGAAGTVTSVAATVPTGFSISGSPITTSGTLAISYAAGYAGVLTASTTNWNTFYNTPSTRIADGTGLTWSSNTLNCDTASGSTPGCLTAADWTSFNGRIASSSLNSLSELETLTGVSNILIESDIDASSELLALMDDETGTNRLVFSGSPAFSGTATFSSLTATGTATFATTTQSGRLTLSGSVANIALGSNYLSSDGDDEGIYITSAGLVGIGTTTPQALLAIGRTGLSGAATAGYDRFYGFTNSTLNAVQYGEKAYLKTTNSTTTTLVGSMFRLEDSTTYANTVRGIEVQAHRGTNTQGENTAISGFGRTFGIRGTTEGDAGGVFEPAGIFGQTKGTTQGNAIRAYSASITTATLLSLFQDTSAFAGTGLEMNFGNTTGSFSSTTASRFVDLQNAGTSKFIVYQDGRTTIIGTTTIGVGNTSQRAGLQIGYGGLCVDNDGSCTASTTGRITSVSSATGNSDVAEMYFSSQSLLPGELVVTDGFLSVRRATKESNTRVLGVVSTKPGFLLGYDDSSLVAGQRGYPLALSGRVPVRLSDENGVIAVGDPLTLSSIPGVAMKATAAGFVVGYALEAFDGSRAYTTGYLDQFGDDIKAPAEATPLINPDVRINDGCSFGAGGATGEADEKCIPTYQTPTAPEDTAAIAEAAYKAELTAIEALSRVPAETQAVGDRNLRIGRVIMFVENGYYQSLSQSGILNELVSTSTDLVLGATEESGETLWSRLRFIAQNFVDGVLTIAGIRSEKIDTKKLCVDDVCVDSRQLRALINLTEETSNQNNRAEIRVDDQTSGGEDSQSNVMSDFKVELVADTVEAVANISIPASESDNATTSVINEVTDDSITLETVTVVEAIPFEPSVEQFESEPELTPSPTADSQLGNGLVE